MDDSRGPKVVRRDIQAVQDWVGALGKSSKYIYMTWFRACILNTIILYYGSESQQAILSIKNQETSEGLRPERPGSKEHGGFNQFLDQIK